MRERLSFLRRKTILSFVLALLMVLTSLSINSVEVNAAGSEYTFTIDPSGNDGGHGFEFWDAASVTARDNAIAYAVGGDILKFNTSGGYAYFVEFTGGDSSWNKSENYSLTNSYTIPSGYKVKNIVLKDHTTDSSYWNVPVFKCEIEVDPYATFTVTFDRNGHGTAPTAISGVTSGSTISAPAAPTEAGYTFGGWYKESGCTNAWDFTSGTVTADTTLYAKWTAEALAGTVTISGTAKYGQTLTAALTGGNNTGTLSYQWKSGGSNVGTGSSYTVAASDIGKTITVDVTSNVQTGTLSSAATSAVEKADGPSAPSGFTGVACTSAGSTGKITGTDATMEYSTDSSFTSPAGTTCGATETTGLAAGTYYIRIKETSDTKAGAVSSPITVAAYTPAALAGTATISPSPIRFGDTLSVVPSLTNQVGTLSYQWQRHDGGAGWVNIAGATGSTYTPVAAEVNKSFRVEIFSSGNTGSVFSYSTAGLGKANGPLAPSVTGVACTTASNDDGKITGTDTTMEYSSDGGSTYSDCAGTEITGLTPGTYYVRVKETATHLVGNRIAITINAYTPGTPVTYTVSFNANGGTGTHSDATGISGSYTLPTTTTFTAPSGKIFDGWSETLGGAKIATSTITIAANKTLYAVWKTATPAPTPTPTPTPSEPSTPSVEEKPATKTVEVNVTYTVARGDTMSKIAKRNGLTLAELKALNPQIKNINVIYSGQVINVGKTTKEVPASETPEKEVPKQTLPDAYIVEKGDSLSKIAKRYNMTLAELVKKNPQIKNINLIRVGEKINIQ